MAVTTILSHPSLSRTLLTQLGCRTSLWRTSAHGWCRSARHVTPSRCRGVKISTILRSLPRLFGRARVVRIMNTKKNNAGAIRGTHHTASSTKSTLEVHKPVMQRSTTMKQCCQKQRILQPNDLTSRLCASMEFMRFVRHRHACKLYHVVKKKKKTR